MLSHTLTRPTAAQAENPYSPLHRLAGDQRSHRLPSLGNSSLVGREHPHRCLECSTQAAAGSPPSRKNRSTCGAAPLNLRPVVCLRRPAEVPCLPSGGARVRRCSVQPCRGRRFLGLCRLRWGGPTFLALEHSYHISYLRSAATASFDKKEFHRNCTVPVHFPNQISKGRQLKSRKHVSRM
jgi:hypothetical protein